MGRCALATGLHRADQKGSKTVVGVADLVGTLSKLSLSDLTANVAKHQVSASEIDGGFNTIPPGCWSALGRCGSRFRSTSR